MDYKCWKVNLLGKQILYNIFDIKLNIIENILLCVFDITHGQTENDKELAINIIKYVIFIEMYRPVYLARL